MTKRTALVLLVSAFATAACGAPSPAIDAPSNASESNAESSDGTPKPSGGGFDSDAADDAPAPDPKKTDAKDASAEPAPAGDDDDTAEPTPTKATCSGDIDEVESNNTAATAMKLPKSGRLCATLSSSTDVDVYTLTASQVTLQFAKESGANIRVSIKGPNSQSSTNGSGTTSFGSGTVQTYTIEVRGDRAAVYGFDIDAQ